MALGRQEGLKEGLKEGRQEGIQECLKKCLKEDRQEEKENPQFTIPWRLYTRTNSTSYRFKYKKGERIGESGNARLAPCHANVGNRC